MYERKFEELGNIWFEVLEERIHGDSLNEFEL